MTLQHRLADALSSNLHTYSTVCTVSLQEEINLAHNTKYALPILPILFTYSVIFCCLLSVKSFNFFFQLCGN